MSQPQPRSLLIHFAALEDPRQHAKVLYPLVEIPLLALFATVAGADDFVETTIWGAGNQAFLRRIFPYENGISSHGTLCDVFAALNLTAFKTCFLAWVEDLRDGAPEVIAIDRKISRRGHDRKKGGNLRTWSPPGPRASGSSEGQQETEEKSNEITAIPLLLQSLDLKGALVIIDEMGTQTRIAQAIRDCGGDDVLSLKENWPASFAEVALLFDQPSPGLTFEHIETVGGCNGRIAIRRHTVCHEIGWMTSVLRYPGEPRFPGLAMLGRVESEVEREGNFQHETRYYVSSASLSAAMFGRVVRAR